MQIEKGLPVSAGCTYGKILYFCARQHDFADELTDDVEYELENLRAAISNVQTSFETNITYMKEQGREQEVILAEARILLLHDMIETCACEDMIQSKLYSARRAVHEAATTLRLQFESLEDEFMRERVSDIKQISELLLQALDGKKQDFPHLYEPSIIVADELIPEGTLCFERQNILGIIIKNSTYNSHASILARLWNIPALAEISSSSDWNGLYGIIDANNGVFYIDPDPKTKNQFGF